LRSGDRHHDFTASAVSGLPADHRRLDARRRRAAELRRVREIAFDLTCKRVAQPGPRRLSLDQAIENCAIGTDQVHAQLSRGRAISRRTTYTRIREAFGEPAGQLNAYKRRPPDCPLWHWAIGANTYDLREACKTSRHAQRKMTWLIAHARWSKAFSKAALASARTAAGGYAHDTRSLSANRVQRRVTGALEWVTRNAETGSGRRSWGGLWLARRCRALGLAQSEVEQIIEQYQRRVCDLGTHPYTQREAQATVRSVFRRPLPAHYPTGRSR
jgi:hypothetical protein